MSGRSRATLGRCLAIVALGTALWAAGMPAAFGQNMTAEEAGVKAAKAFEQLRKLGFTDLKLGEYIDRSQTVRDGDTRVKAPAWRIIATNGGLEERDLAPGQEIWSIYVDIYPEERIARLAWETLTSATGGLPHYQKPPAQFMITPGGLGVIGIARSRIYGAVRATFRCGNVLCRVEVLAATATAATTPQEYWNYRMNLVKAKAELIHKAFHSNGVCAGRGPQEMTIEPQFAGPGTTVDVDVLGEVPLPNATIDFGPGIEQYAPAEPITNADTERPSGKAFGYRCHLRLRPDVPLGERTVKVTGADGARHDVKFMVKPLVLVIDIDGFRHDVLMQCLTGRPVATPNTQPGLAPNLHRIFGNIVGQRQDGALRLTQFERGFILDDAITVFPSYTFPSQASLVMGTEPGVHGLPGNAIFDRMTKINYGFDGSEKGSYFVGQAMDVYYKQLADKLLRGESVYSTLQNAAPPQKALSIFHQYRAGLPPERLILPDVIDQALFVPAATTHHYDRNATEELEKRLKTLPSPTPDNLSRLSEWFSLIWLYLPGVDHYTHASEWSFGLEQAPDTKVKIALNTDTPTKEVSAYSQYIDPLLDKVLNFLQQYPGTIVIVVSDHGHTDTREAHDISWEPLQLALGDGYNMWDTGKNIDECDVVARLNSGLAHIYVNNVTHKQDQNCGQHWNEKPDYFRVRDIASRFESFNSTWKPIPELAGTPPYFDLILVRETARDGWNGPYYVYDPSQANPLETIQSYLTRTNNAFGVRLGWANTPQDIAFIADRINAMSCDRSGDVVVLPHYPPPARLRKAGESYYHFTGGNYASQHGGLSMDDMNMSFAVAQLGCPNPDNLLSMLRRTIANPARPRILDVSSTAAGFCGVNFRGSGPAPNAGVIDRPDTGHFPPLTSDKKPASHDTPEKPPKPPAPKTEVTADLDRETPPPANPEIGRLAAGAGQGTVTRDAEKQSWGQADRANAFREQGKLAEARAAMLKALESNPNAWYLWDGLSDLCTRDKMWPDAETSLRTASRLAPNNGTLHLKLAQALMMQQKRDEAIAEARTALRLGADGAKQLLEMLEK